jgi:hypothetical protein
VFPSGAQGGHLEQGTGKTQHSAAIAKINSETVKANAKREAAGLKPLPLPLPAFEPYVMRHTALTRMAPFCDAFTLARIKSFFDHHHTAVLSPSGRCRGSRFLEIWYSDVVDGGKEESNVGWSFG